MVSWHEVVAAAPELATAVEARFAAHVHKTMATLRADGSPRISGTELVVADGELWLGCMPGSRKADDLRRDPRVAVHSGSEDPPGWSGDAKVSGRAVESPQDWQRVYGGTPQAALEGLLFRLDVQEAVTVRLGEPADHLVITSWTPGRGLREVRRT